MSRFRIANGMQAAVAEAFAHRPGLVDRQPGFLGLEVYTDAADDALFYLVTRWTDRPSFEAWHHSKAHHESHRGMPRGMKLDKAFTKLFVMNRMASGAGADGLAPAARDPGEEGALLEEMTRINNEVVDLSRESARKGQALARALQGLEEKNVALEAANERITQLSRTDPMTGIFNRRHFDETFATEIARTRRSGSSLCVVMVDLDHFKSVNDRYGHGVGDAVLIGAAAALKTSSRPHDIVARYGGEEFVLLLPDTALEGGAGCAERLRIAIEALQVEGYPHRITASLGVATLTAGESGDALVGRADAALYRAKEGGRNRVGLDLPHGVPLPGSVAENRG
jgi:diguanylate cyclase (GGDEF)-like protein